MIGLILVISILTVSDNKEMIIVVIIVNLIIVTISSLHGLDQFHGLLKTVVGFPIDGSEGRVNGESQGLLICCYLQRLPLVLQGLGVPLVEGDVPLVIIVLHGKIVVVIIVQIRESFY